MVEFNATQLFAVLISAIAAFGALFGVVIKWILRHTDKVYEQSRELSAEFKTTIDNHLRATNGTLDKLNSTLDKNNNVVAGLTKVIDGCVYKQGRRGSND